MAEKAATSKESTPVEDLASQGTTKKTRTRQTKAKVAPAVSDAIAESLAELKVDAPERTKKRPKPHMEEADSILEKLESSEPSAPRSRKKAVTEKGESRAPAKKAKAAPAQSGNLFASGVEDSKDEASEVRAAPAMTALLFQEPDMTQARTRKRNTAQDSASVKKSVEPAQKKQGPTAENQDSVDNEQDSADSNRRRRGSRGRRKVETDTEETRDEKSVKKPQEPTGKEESVKTENAKDETSEPATVTRRRRRRTGESSDEVAAPKGSTRLEAKRQRRKEGRDAGRRRHSITESEYLVRRESVKRDMLVREQDGLNQIAVLEDGILVEHYVARHTQVSMVGNVYLGRVQNVLPSMEAAFVDIGKGRNAVLYAGEVNWEAAGMEGKPRRIEQALKSGDTVLVQVTKDPIGHKGARLTAQITLAGRHLVLVPSGAMTGISRKLPDKERQRLKKLLREIVPPEHGVIVRTAAEGASEDQLRADVDRLTKAWADIQSKSKNFKSAPVLLKGEPELAVRVVRDIFNEDFQSLVVQGDEAWTTISEYVNELSPELTTRLSHWTRNKDVFAEHRVDEQLAKAFDRKVWLPSGGTLIIDRTEAMTVIDVNTGKFTGAGGTLEETVTRNNLEAAEEIVRQLRLRDIGGIIVVDFIDMVLEANRELVLRRLVECLGRDRTRHQVAEVTSLGLIQMTRKRVGQGLVEAFSTPCEACEGSGFITHSSPVERDESGNDFTNRRKAKAPKRESVETSVEEEPKHEETRAAINSIAAAAKNHTDSEEPVAQSGPKNGRNKNSNQNSAKNGGAKRNSDARKSDSQEAQGSRQKADGKKANGQKSAGKKRPENKGASSQTSASKNVDSKNVSAPTRNVEPPVSAPEETGESQPARRTRRVSSSGTITPRSSSTSPIMSFPA